MRALLFSTHRLNTVDAFDTTKIQTYTHTEAPAHMHTQTLGKKTQNEEYTQSQAIPHWYNNNNTNVSVIAVVSTIRRTILSKK